MSSIVQSLTQTLELLANLVMSGAEGAYHRIAPKASVYLKSLASISVAALVTIPTLGILKAVTGQVIFGYLMALMAVVLTAILGLMWSPLCLLVGLLLGETHSPRMVGVKYVRLVAMIMFFELIAAMYISYIPFHRNPSSVPLLFIAATAVILGSAIWGGWLSGKFYVFIALLMVIKIILSDLFPEKATEIAEWLAEWDSGATYQTMEFKGSRRRLKVADRFIVEIPPNNQLSEKVLISAQAGLSLKRSGYLEIVFKDGRVVKWPRGQKSVDAHPGFDDFTSTEPTEFRLRGDPGIVVITLTEDPLGGLEQRKILMKSWNP